MGNVFVRDSDFYEFFYYCQKKKKVGVQDAKEF